MNDLAQFRKQLRSSYQRLEDVMSTTAQESAVVGRFPVNNAGEAYKTLLFDPVVFATIPTITFGFEIEGDNNIKTTRAPVITASVYSWKLQERNPASPLYTGADILVVSTGPALVKFTVTWNATGVAFANPWS